MASRQTFTFRPDRVLAALMEKMMQKLTLITSVPRSMEQSTNLFLIEKEIMMAVKNWAIKCIKALDVEPVAKVLRAQTARV